MTEDFVDESYPEVRDFAAALLALAPQVADALTARGDEHAPDPEFPISWMSQAGVALARSLDDQPQETRAGAFALVEERLAQGSTAMREAVATGLLEALASEVSGGRADPGTVAALLGPQSRAYLDAWDQFTLGRSSLDPREPGQRLHQRVRPGGRPGRESPARTLAALRERLAGEPGTADLRRDIEAVLGGRMSLRALADVPAFRQLADDGMGQAEEAWQRLSPEERAAQVRAGSRLIDGGATA
jgi:hypothetical protein